MGYGFCSWSMWWKSSCYMEITSCIYSLKLMINKVCECFLNAVAANDFGTVMYINLPDPEALLLHTKQGRWAWISNEQPSVGLEWFNSGVHSKLFNKGFAFCNNISTLQATGSCLTHPHHFSFNQLGAGIEIDSVWYVGIAMKI